MNFEYVILPWDAIISDGIYNATVWQLNEENITKTKGCIHYLLMNLLWNYQTNVLIAFMSNDGVREQ